MSDRRKDEIIYEEGWQSYDADNFEEIDLSSDDDISDELTLQNDEIIEKKKPKKTVVSLITIQLIISIILAFLVFMFKSINGDTYRTIKNWYTDSMKNTLVPDKTFEDIDLSGYTDSTPDESVATKDEF